MFYILILLCAFILVFHSTLLHSLLKCALEGGGLITYQLHSRYHFVSWTTVCCSVFDSVMQCIAVHYNVVYSHLTGNVLTFLVLLFDSGHSLELYLLWTFNLFIKILTTYTLHFTFYELACNWCKSDVWKCWSNWSLRAQVNTYYTLFCQ